MKIIVCGTFSDDKPKASSIGQKIGESLGCEIINGGKLQLLDKTLTTISNYNTIIWIPNIDNSIDKFLPNIKTIAPHSILVSSKRCIEKQYSEFDVISHMLHNKCNLGIMITHDGAYLHFKLLDPLGNQYAFTSDVDVLASAMNSRIETISKFTRLKSIRLGDQNQQVVLGEFKDIIHQYASEFSKYVNAINQNRFLGNVATRCTFGFPAMRDSGIFVSRRNVDKTGIREDDFVEVKPIDATTIGYFGQNKPSVDAPVQIALFENFQNINYMIHGHVYVDGAPFTCHKIPCGAFEEVHEISSKIRSTANEFSINLLGHGCIIAASNLDYFKNVKLKPRPFPEW